MPEQLPRSGALAGLSRTGNYGAHPAAPGVMLHVRDGLSLVDLRGDPANAAFLAAAAAALGAPLPLAPNTAAGIRDGVALATGPDQWLLVGEGLSEPLPLAGGFLTDVSHGRTAIRVSGARARELLAKGCSLDLHPRAWQSGRCAQTSIARVGVLLHLGADASVFDLYCARSYAAHLWHWLTESAAELGYQVA